MNERELIERYDQAWNDHDVDAIVSMHAPDMVFENHTAGERAEGAAVGPHIAEIFRNWPDLQFRARRLYERHGFMAYGVEPGAINVDDQYLDEALMIRVLDNVAVSMPTHAR